MFLAFYTVYTITRTQPSFTLRALPAGRAIVTLTRYVHRLAAHAYCPSKNAPASEGNRYGRKHGKNSQERHPRSELHKAGESAQLAKGSTICLL